MTATRVLPTIADLSLREKLAQLIFVRIGSNLPPIRRVEEDEDRVRALLAECPVGGLLLFNGGPQTKVALAELQQAAKYPLLVASDIERGVGQQVRGYTLFPHAMAFHRQTANIEPYIEVLAQEARDAGIHITFGPVADVNTNPQNPIISIRAYSDDPEQAAQSAAQYVAAAENRGLFTTAKHFPGHGDTQQDSHDSLPLVEKSLDELRACELLPFQAAIDAGCSLVMTAHVAFPNVDPSGSPATLSPLLLNDLLRNEMGFQGVICSDSLLMAGVRDRFESEGEMALVALKSGVDLLLDINDPAGVVEYLAARVDDGALSKSRVDEAFARLWGLKQRAFAAQSEPAITAGGRIAAERSAQRLSAEVARGAIEVVGDTSELLPLDRERPLGAILLKTFELPSDPPEQPLADALRQVFRDVAYVQLGPHADAAQFAAAERLANDRPQLVVAMIVKPAAWHAFGLLPALRALVERLCRERDVVLACLGVPSALADYPQAKVRICTYSDVPVSQQALAEYLVSQARLA